MRMVLPRRSMLADFGKNGPGSATDQVLSKRDTQLMRLRRISRRLSGNHDCACKVCDESLQNDPAAIQLSVAGDGHLATAFERGEQSAFSGDGDACRVMVENRETLTSTGIVRPAGNGKGSLTDGGEHELLFEDLSHHRFASQPTQTGESEHDGIKFSIREFAESRVDIAPQVNNAHGRESMPQLDLSSEAARTDARSRREGIDPSSI